MAQEVNPQSRLASGLARCYPWLIGACCLAPFAGLLVPDKRTLPDGPSRDFIGYQLPVREYARSEILAGRFPLWIPYLGAGLPLHAGQQASLCHPLVMPLVLALGAGYGLKVCLLLNFIIGYAGMYHLARYHAISRPASGLAGVVATWSGFAINHLMAGHVTLILQYALVPWFFLTLAVLLRHPGPLPTCALAAVAVCSALSGHPQVLYYTLLLGGLWACGSLLARDARTQRVACVACGLVAAVLALLASAVQILPSAELARDGLKGSFRNQADFSVQHAMTGLDVVRLLAPNIVGNPFAGPPGTGIGENFHERVVYLGLGAPLLALYGLSRAGAARWQWRAAWLVVLALSIGLGDSTPVFGVLKNIVPGLGHFRCPGRVFGVASVLIALLAARGFDDLVYGKLARRGAQWISFTVLIWCLVNLAACALLENRDGLKWRDDLVYVQGHLFGDAMVLAALAIDSAAVFWFARRLGITHARAAYALALILTLVDLSWNNVRNFSLEVAAPAMLPKPLVRDGKPRRFVQGPVWSALSREQLRYSGLVPAAIAARRELLGTKEGGVLPAATERLFRAAQSNARIALAVAGCDYACSQIDGKCEALAQPLPRFRFLAEEDAPVIETPIEELRDGDVERMRERSTGTVNLAVDNPQRVAIDIDAPSAGRLVLADTFYPGWKATVDGKDTAIDRAHGVFRSVGVPKGHHRVVFSYEPLSFRLGLAGTAIGIVSCHGLLTFGVWRRAHAT
jgi:hypothetical protein